MATTKKTIAESEEITEITAAQQTRLAALKELGQQLVAANKAYADAKSTGNEQRAAQIKKYIAKIAAQKMQLGEDDESVEDDSAQAQQNRKDYKNSGSKLPYAAWVKQGTHPDPINEWIGSDIQYFVYLFGKDGNFTEEPSSYSNRSEAITYAVDMPSIGFVIVGVSSLTDKIRVIRSDFDVDVDRPQELAFKTKALEHMKQNFDALTNKTQDAELDEMAAGKKDTPEYHKAQARKLYRNQCINGQADDETEKMDYHMAQYKKLTGKNVDFSDIDAEDRTITAESEDQINELSPDTLVSYASKATKDRRNLVNKQFDADPEEAAKLHKKAQRRGNGVATALHNFTYGPNSGHKQLEGEAMNEPELDEASDGGYNDMSKPYGVRWKAFAGREQRVTTKEKFFKTSEQMEKFVEQLTNPITLADEKIANGFYGIDSYCFPREVTESTRHKPYGVRWTTSDNLSESKEQFFETKKQLDEFTDRLVLTDGFYEIDAWCFPKDKLVTEVSQATKDSYLMKAIPDAGAAAFAKKYATGQDKQEWERMEKNRKKGISRAYGKDPVDEAEVRAIGPNEGEEVDEAFKKENSNSQERTDRSRAGVRIKTPGGIGVIIAEYKVPTFSQTAPFKRTVLVQFPDKSKEEFDYKLCRVSKATPTVEPTFEEVCTEANEGTDQICMTVPLFIRCLEWAKEDAPDDVALHQFTENIIAQDGCLDVEDYDSLIPTGDVAEGAEQGDDVGLNRWKNEKFDHIFIRKCGPGERSAAGRRKAMRSIPPKDGYEIVYKPYGNSGQREDAGFYYFGKSQTNEGAEQVDEISDAAAKRLLMARINQSGSEEGDIKKGRAKLAIAKRAERKAGSKRPDSYASDYVRDRMANNMWADQKAKNRDMVTMSDTNEDASCGGTSSGSVATGSVGAKRNKDSIFAEGESVVTEAPTNKAVKTESGSVKVFPQGVKFNNSGFKKSFTWAELDSMNNGETVKGFYKDDSHPYADDSTYVYTSGDEEHHLPVSVLDSKPMGESVVTELDNGPKGRVKTDNVSYDARRNSTIGSSSSDKEDFEQRKAAASAQKAIDAAGRRGASRAQERQWALADAREEPIELGRNFDFAQMKKLAADYAGAHDIIDVTDTRNYRVKIDDTVVAALEVNVYCEYDLNDFGYDEATKASVGGENVSDAIRLRFARDPKNPKKIVFRGFGV